MDDLFQYLIYGILIFSFLSSFFKKKEKPAENSTADETEEVQGHAVKRIIDHIAHDEQQSTDQKTND